MVMAMNIEKNYRDTGYRQGFEDGRMTRGKINKRYVDFLLETETRNLSTKDSLQYKNGWQEGFIDAVRGSIRNAVADEDCVQEHVDNVFHIG